MSLRLRLLSALPVLAAAATLVGSALAGSSNTAAAPSSSFTGTSSSGGSPSSSFSGSGTSGSSGDEGLGSDDSGSFASEGGSGTAGVAGFGPGGATGMTVAAVRRLQAELARLGYFHHIVTGYYGLVTTAAVKQFQRSAGLKSDGIWGRRSETALKRRLSGK
jgi:Putative peptidoglycan binding domain